MLTVYLTKNSRQGVWLDLSSTPAEQKEALAALDAIKSRRKEIWISEALSSIHGIREYMHGFIFTNQALEELLFLENRINGLGKRERLVFGGALEIEKPQTLMDIVNVSCNLDSYEYFKGIASETELKEYLHDREYDQVLKEQTVRSEYQFAGLRYTKKHDSRYNWSKMVAKMNPMFISRYDGRHLPDPCYEKNSPFVITIRQNGTFMSLYLPEPEFRLNKMKEMFHLNLNERAQLSEQENIEGLYSRLPHGASIQELNDLAVVLRHVLDGTEENRNKVLAVLEAEAPVTVEETAGVLERLEQDKLISGPEKFKETDDCEAFCKVVVKEGAVQTTFGSVGRAGHAICKPTKEFTGKPESEMKEQPEQRQGQQMDF